MSWATSVAVTSKSIVPAVKLIVIVPSNVNEPSCGAETPHAASVMVRTRSPSSSVRVPPPGQLSTVSASADVVDWVDSALELTPVASGAPRMRKGTTAEATDCAPALTDPDGVGVAVGLPPVPTLVGVAAAVGVAAGVSGVPKGGVGTNVAVRPPAVTVRAGVGPSALAVGPFPRKMVVSFESPHPAATTSAASTAATTYALR